MPVVIWNYRDERAKGCSPMSRVRGVGPGVPRHTPTASTPHTLVPFRTRITLQAWHGAPARDFYAVELHGVATRTPSRVHRHTPAAIMVPRQACKGGEEG